MSFSDDQEPTTDREPAAFPPRGVVTPAEEEAQAVSIADGREQRLDPRAITAAKLSGGIAASILSAVLLIGVVVLALFGPLGPVGWLLFPAGWMVFCGLLGGFVLWWPGIRHRHIDYRVTDQGIRIRRGVFWRSVHSIPKSRVQHTDVSQGPIERLFELSTLVIYTAGTEHASITLGGLARETAFLIRDHLIEGGADDAV